MEFSYPERPPQTPRELLEQLFGKALHYAFLNDGIDLAILDEKISCLRDLIRLLFHQKIGLLILDEGLLSQAIAADQELGKSSDARSYMGNRDYERIYHELCDDELEVVYLTSQEIHDYIQELLGDKALKTFTDIEFPLTKDPILSPEYMQLLRSSAFQAYIFVMVDLEKLEEDEALDLLSPIMVSMTFPDGSVLGGPKEWKLN